MDDVTSLIEGLNPAQRDAVTAEDRHLLVLAGAGSGKTRVLVHRIAWQIATEQASPFGILAVTFTNKAAAEMRGRIEQLLDMPAGGMCCLLYTSPSPRDRTRSRMPSSA